MLGFTLPTAWYNRVPEMPAKTLSSSDSSMTYTIDLFAKNYPAADTVGVHWVFYDIASPESRYNFKDYSNNYTIVFSGDLFVSGDIGLNFPDPPPVHGDSIIIFGSWDSCYNNNPSTYGDNPNHTGFYWLFFG